MSRTKLAKKARFPICARHEGEIAANLILFFLSIRARRSLFSRTQEVSQLCPLLEAAFHEYRNGKRERERMCRLECPVKVCSPAWILTRKIGEVILDGPPLWLRANQKMAIKKEKMNKLNRKISSEITIACEERNVSETSLSDQSRIIWFSLFVD